MQETNNDINTQNKIESSNIFDDFSQDSNLVDEVNKIKVENNKDKFYYLSKTATFLQSIFIVLFILALGWFTYVTIQNKDIWSSNILDPICFIIAWDIPSDETYCSSITHLNNKYNTYLTDEKAKQSTPILSILEKLYEVKNFTKTKEVLFLLDKSENKLKVLSVLEEFDKLKNDFDNVDKQKIQCNLLTIDSKDSSLSMNCFAYSAWFEKWFKWFDADNSASIKWTSLSIANSFINFLSLKSSIFTIVDRQKVFKSESIIWEKTDFTNKTNFSLKLKYNIK